MALSIAHDSHNIITVGTNDEDMLLAVEELIKQGGGIILVKDGLVINSMPMVVGGIMSDQSGEWVCEKLTQIHKDAYEQLGISKAVEPVMTLCFMSLAVIPEIKLTDKGLLILHSMLYFYRGIRKAEKEKGNIDITRISFVSRRRWSRSKNNQERGVISCRRFIK